MPSEKAKYEPYENLPIPTYEEATSSRPTSSQADRGPQEACGDAERQGLLRHGLPNDQPRGETRGQYRSPTVESARSSLDTDLFSLDLLVDGSSGGSDEGLRQEMVQMEVLDPEARDTARESLFRQRLSKRFTTFSRTLSSIQLPFRVRLPSLDNVRSCMSQMRASNTSGFISLGRIIAILLILLLLYTLFVTEIFPTSGMGMIDQAEAVRVFVQSNVDESNIRDNLEHITAYDHVAGTEGSYALALWIQKLFKAADLEDAIMDRYDVYLNYPKAAGRRVAIVEPQQLSWEALIEEEPAYDNPSPQQGQTPVFHGHSRAGNVTGPLIYVNYGSREDFKLLKDRGIDVKGAVALVRYYGTQGDRALKVKAAELAGAVGCIIYSDPQEDGFVRGKPFPEGRWRPSDGVQRGAVSLMSWVVGDVLSPGFASLPSQDSNRIPKDNNPGLNNIPSIPLAWRDAQKLLQVIKGHGEKVSEDWIGGVPDVDEWWSGDSTSPIVHLMNEQEEIERQPIYNVGGQIAGIQQTEKTVYVGNHRDAWCYGATDPGSGTAIMLEVVRIFGELKKLGWRPLRTISFHSWDAEEYNLVGSTEFVEADIDTVRRDGVAYLNVDVGVSGSDFRAAASPVFQRALLRVLDRTTDPVKNQTLRSLWDENGSKLEGLGAGSDYVAFQDLAGTSSIDFGFTGPGYPYHSCYDNFEWMKNFGDPGFQYHKVLAQVWALLILEIADKPVLPFDFPAYATEVKSYVEDLRKYALERAAISSKDGSVTKLDLEPLAEAAESFEKNAEIFETWERHWTEQVYSRDGAESNVLAIHRMSHNTRMSNFETHLLDLEEGGGLPGREQFKHVIFAPQAWSGYDEAFFPGIRDAVDDDDWALAQHQVQKAADLLSHASYKLIH
ncbi:MAG: hypothetical protein M1819_004825 [Sarea resinae]|nr:MAG: hypothetical protein M1819_004825 [Sarea resinae]